jgi:NhaA family Na+:H+ antiporter
MKLLFPAAPTVARRFTALLGFLRSEVAGGAILIVAAAAALIWANSAAAPVYFWFRDLSLGFVVEERRFMLPLHLWVNDGLMTLFFLLVSLEIRREMMEGQLASVRTAAAPAIAALGGMIAPAVIYWAFNHGDAQAMRGWAVPIATDIAFSLAVLRVLGRRVPVAVFVFLSALAIMDDLGAIIVIAAFYTEHIGWIALGCAIVVGAVLYAMGRAGIRSGLAYAIGGFALWACFFGSGIHPTLAGVALAFLLPMAERSGEAASPARRIQAGLAGLVGYFVLPLFGLVNAGFSVEGLPASVLHDPVVLGIAVGLVAGKQLGVFGATFAACRLRLIRLPGGISMRQLYGAAILCGIGFTMSLFIGDLAFASGEREIEVKLSVFAASLVSAVLGLLVLAWATRKSTRRVSR